MARLEKLIPLCAAVIVALGIFGFSAREARADDDVRVECDRDGDDCQYYREDDDDQTYQYRCDRDGDDCRPYICDEDGDDCRPADRPQPRGYYSPYDRRYGW